ncbi:MAG TPA: bifunctional enoyl-CoA hydratase/phosphate acetyltransferase [Candidatus Acidoferrales bacterium]|nr:bifunctional enoyl-CoA hydratase/phosphate acetyltransferase [Candidatus Acidoferrales bacterium]
MSEPSGDSHHARLIARCAGRAAILTAVVHPCDRLALEGALACARAGLIVPVLVGNERKIRAVARDAAADLGEYRIVEAAHSHEAAAVAAALARDGRVEAIMKGSIHSDELLHEVVRPDSGLHTQRRMSHAYVVDLPNREEPLIVTDAAINVLPTLAQKRDIAANAIDLAKALEMPAVRVAVLSAVETVNASIPSTLEAAALAKMAERGQIAGAVVDGPMALDDAVDEAAAREKGLKSGVAGRANVLVVPNFESGNMLAKALILLAGAAAAGIVLGARVPVILTGRADGVSTRLASAAIALLLARRS